MSCDRAAGSKAAFPIAQSLVKAMATICPRSLTAIGYQKVRSENTAVSSLLIFHLVTHFPFSTRPTESRRREGIRASQETGQVRAAPANDQSAEPVSCHCEASVVFGIANISEGAKICHAGILRPDGAMDITTRRSGVPDDQTGVGDVVQRFLPTNSIFAAQRPQIDPLTGVRPKSRSPSVGVPLPVGSLAEWRYVAKTHCDAKVVDAFQRRPGSTGVGTELRCCCCVGRASAPKRGSTCASRHPHHAAMQRIECLLLVTLVGPCAHAIEHNRAQRIKARMLMRFMSTSIRNKARIELLSSKRCADVSPERVMHPVGGALRGGEKTTLV